MTFTARWDAVLARDRELDGSFVYAVRSTGVYCRPSCPSRRPRRDRVVFFDGGDAARAAGFRACRRCRPDERAGEDPWIDKIRRACEYLASVDGHPSLAALTERVGGSPYHFQRNFKRLVGVSPREYAEACRLNKVKRGLQHGGDVTTAMVDAGYGSSSRFYERAVPKLGMLPSAYRHGGPGATIGFTIVGSALGRLLVAATARGVCAVKLGDSDATLRSELAREFNAATILEDDESLTKWTRAVLSQLDAPSTEAGPERAHPSAFAKASADRRSAKRGGWSTGSGRARRRAARSIELPLDVRATAFQWQVWQALTAIPYGETRTYGDIAVAIGQPKAVRAVARACATNPVALAIPCHRVVPANGGEGGYRWGAARKTALLRQERARKLEVRR